MGHPSRAISEVAALLGVLPQRLGGWTEDTLAALRAEAECSPNPLHVSDLLRATGGAPLFALQAVRVISDAGGDTAAYARALLSGANTGRSAQEVLLDGVVRALSSADGRVASLLACVDLALSFEEWVEAATVALGIAPTSARRSLHAVVELGLAYTTEGGLASVHDTFRPLLVERFVTAVERRGLLEHVASHIKAQLLGERAGERIVAYVRIMAALGRLSEVADLANAISEWIRDTGTIAEVRGHLETVLANQGLSAEDTFWALDSLAFFDLEEGDVAAAEARVSKMKPFADESDDPATKGALLHKRLLVASVRGDIATVRGIAVECPADHGYSRVIRYQAAVAEAQGGNIRESVKRLLGIADEYLEDLGLTRDLVLGRNIPELQSMISPTANTRDVHHLADCYDAVFKFARRVPEMRRQSAMFAIWAMKFFAMARADRCALNSGQDVVDVMLAEWDDPDAARAFMEKTLLPAANQARLPDKLNAVRSHYAVVCAYCGDFSTADEMMARLWSYADGLPELARAELENQRRIVDSLRNRPPLGADALAARARRISEQLQFADKLRDKLGLRPQIQRKVARNEPCPCGSGKKYKKCCAQN